MSGKRHHLVRVRRRDRPNEKPVGVLVGSKDDLEAVTLVQKNLLPEYTIVTVEDWPVWEARPPPSCDTGD